MLVDRDEADALYRDFAAELQHAAEQARRPRQQPARVVLRTLVLDLLARRRQSGDSSIPIPEIDPPTEEERFDAIWRSQLLDRTWQRLKILQDRTGEPFHLALQHRAEAPGLSATELADRIARALDRPLPLHAAQALLRRAHGEFARILLDEVVATLPDDAPFESIERELIKTNLLAFCRDAVGGLRRRSSPSQPSPPDRSRRRPSP